MVFREQERGALDLLLLSGEQCAGASSGWGPRPGDRFWGDKGEGKQVLQSTGASVCCDRVGV